MTFPDLLFQKFLEWQQQSGKRRTVQDFALHLGVSQSALSNWLNGVRTPGLESLVIISAKLGPEVYDVLGLERPDPDLAFVTQQWEKIDPATRRTIRELAERFDSKNDNTERTSQKRRTRTAH